MFKVSARTVLELGSELISSDIIAFYELVKNGFDAKTTTGVEIHFNLILRRNSFLTLKLKIEGENESVDDLRVAIKNLLDVRASTDLFDKALEFLTKAKTIDALRKALSSIYSLNNIVISDSGSGMSLDELNKNFLLLGTPSRKSKVDEALQTGAAKSPFLGEKGIGRLSAMRLGNRLRVETARCDDSNINLLEINWADFERLDAMLEDIDVKPIKGESKPKANWSGTKIIISDLSEDWTENRLDTLVKLDFSRLTDPFLDPKLRPRIAIFWNSERKAIPWMDRNLLEHAHARIAGSYTIENGVPQLRCKVEAIKLGFEHPKETAVMVFPLPDLQGAITGTSKETPPDSALTSVGPFDFEAHWFNRRLLGAIEGIGEMKAVRELQQSWSGILLFRDGFRVFPYGEDDDDWLALDRKALGRTGYSLNKTQFVGRVTISRTANPDLIDQTNREGLRVTPSQQVLLGILQYAIDTVLFDVLKETGKKYKNQKIDLSSAKSEIANLEARTKTALNRLKKIVPKDEQEVIEDLHQAMFEFSEFAARARQRITEVEEESQQMIEMAGVGLMVEVVAHELARASENALENLELLRKRQIPLEIRGAVESLRAQMKSLSKRVRILDPLSISGRQRTEIFALDELLRETLSAHEAQFSRHNIVLEFAPPKKSMRVKAVKGMIVQIIENLISNSKYWMQMRKLREPSYRPVIKIVIHDNPPTIIYEDNGPGIAVENRDRIFNAFFSLKEKSKRRGLGLYIARECAKYNGGTLELNDAVDRETNRLHRFTLELPKNASVP